MRWRRSIGCAAGAAALLLATPAAAVHSYTVVIEKMKFGSLPEQLHKGDTIVWVNKDFLRHTATAADHSFDVDLQPGAKAAIILKKSGTIAFACRYHPGMHGVLEVK